jgi:hypothetical protein
LRPFLFLVVLMWAASCFGQATVLWNEGFETDAFWDFWHVEGGVWAVGTPTTGPGRAFAGLRCAATSLDGNYPPGADARFVRDREFVVPAATDNPRLRFWHWFQGGPGALRTVEVKVGTAPWQSISPVSGWVSDDWSRASFDLSPFSGQSVQIAFHFQSDTNTVVGPGWFVDEVDVETGPVGADLINSAESFETGLGAWSIDHDVWQVGAPTFGPTAAHSGTNCVGTVLNGNYPATADSRLISPELLVPSASDNPRLRFWHWFSIYTGDVAQVEISVSGGAWQALSAPFVNNSAVWTEPSIDLSAYAGQSVQIAFHLTANGDYLVAAGWYIDDVVIETGPTDWDPVNQPQGFESGLGNWQVDNGTWEAGTPSWGPTQTPEGNQCAGTVLAWNYWANVSSRLISPEFVVPAATNSPRLRFWHWLRNAPGDPATVEIRVAGGQWQALSDPMVANDGTWARPLFDLTAYAGQRVQIAFHFHSNEDNTVGPGWYVDDVRVEIGSVQTNLINHPEGFEQGLGDWSVDKGTWNVGVPGPWPPSAHQGTNAAGTVVGGLYSPNVDSRLISPNIALPAAGDNPRLRFWHWFSIYPGDSGTVEISVAGGPWQALSQQFSGSSVVWTRPLFDLRPYAGQTVRVAFRFQSDADFNIGVGWYVDEVEVETGPMDMSVLNQAEGFEEGLGNWSVDNGTWEVGAPGSGPYTPFKGTNCAATVLAFSGGYYYPNTDSRLISPEFSVPCVDAGPRLRFAQWYDIASGDQGTVEVREPGGPWQQVLGPISGQSQEWITGFYDLSPYAGKRLQLAFHFQSNGDTNIATGWYIDEVKIQASVLATVPPVTIPEGKLYSQSFFSPCQNLVFSLGPGAPDGVSIDPNLGLLVWVPSEAQGPGEYTIQVCASSADHPDKTIDCTSFSVTVLEVNTPPSLAPIPAQVVAANVPIQFTATAYDADLPPQHLQFSLDQGAPVGASIDPVTGAFSWTPTPTQATDQYTITVRVTDDGNPPMSATTSFTAAPQGPISAAHVRIARNPDNSITICIEGGTQGSIYNIETLGALHGPPSAGDWTVLSNQPIWNIGSAPCQTIAIGTNNVGFFRVRSE